MELRKVTRKGAKLLREMYGKDWHKKIDLSKLDLENCKQCILGQLYGDFDEGLAKVGLTLDLSDPANGKDDDVRIQHGFTTNNNRLWCYLTNAWIRLIQDYSRRR